VHVDNPASLQLVDSLFNRLLNSSHSLAVVYERRFL
jgi:hypothetical protein